MTVTTTTEGPAILIGYVWRLQIKAEEPVFPDGAEYAGQIRVKPSDATVLATITSAGGGIARISGTVLELALTPEQTAVLSPGRIMLDLVRTDVEPDLHLGFLLEIPVQLPVTRELEA